MSRRTLLGTGLVVTAGAGAVVASRVTGTLDDALRSVGVRPHPEPDPGDERRLARAGADQAALVAAIDATSQRHSDLAGDLDPLRRVAAEQLRTVGAWTPATATPTPSDDSGEAVKALAETADTAADARGRDVIEAVSPDVARVLASMAAGLAQLGRTIAQVA